METNQLTAAGIVTYNPDLNRLKENIDSILPQVSRVLICDNGSGNWKEVQNLADLYCAQGSNVSCELLDRNMGIACALNQLCQKADELGFDWILTLDQDSVSVPGMVDSLLAHADQKTGVCAPRIVYRNNEAFAPSFDREVEETDWVITSASLTSLNAWREIGGFDNELFIDKVDTDFCLRAKCAGYSIKIINSTLLHHELGSLKCRKVAGRTIFVTNHSAFRRYYMSRNTILLKKKLGTGHPAADVAKNVLKVLVFEDKKPAKLKAIYRGVKDGLNWNGSSETKAVVLRSR